MLLRRQHFHSGQRAPDTGEGSLPRVSAREERSRQTQGGSLPDSTDEEPHTGSQLRQLNPANFDFLGGRQGEATLWPIPGCVI